jgi:asparagine synthase (glutamine-hydrolysing)
MCGINGIFAYGDSAPPVDEAELLRTREHMAKRGPDGAGSWISGDRRVGLAHRRLAIIDLSEAGAQPMATPDGRLRITFNGEIYNYRELRRELEAKGFAFRSNSDTEVLLHLYADRGRAMVQALRGMYAFAIWNEREKGLFLARDPFGIKPLYYADCRGEFRFASQVKALLAGGKLESELDPAGVVGFFVWGCVPEPFTISRAIRALPAGSTMWIGAAGCEAHRPYFSVGDELATAAQQRLSPAESRGRLRYILTDSLRHHLVSDVPVGVFLSAGVDSSTITAIAAEASSTQLHTLTLGFDEFRGTADDEVPLAEAVARKCGTRQHTTWVTKADFESDFDALLSAMDQPSTDGVNTYLVSKRAAEEGMKVALSGLGGDELFGGYPSFRHIPMIRRYLGFGRALPVLGRLARRGIAPLLRRFASPKFASLLEYGGSDGGAYLLRRSLFMPWELPEFMDAASVAQGWGQLRTIPALEASIAGVRGIHSRIAAMELQWYMRNQLLRDADWAGMAHSLEIRVPLIDHVLFRELASLIVSRMPPDKARFAAAPSVPPPPEIIKRRKTGFVVPVREWIAEHSDISALERGLRGWARAVLPVRRGARVLSLTTDAFGGYGGIAQFNRDLLSALCAIPEVTEVVAVPRLMPGASQELPPKLTYATGGLGGKGRYVLEVIRQIARSRRVDLIVCGHINLLPLAYAAKLATGSPLLLCIYGIDAWGRPESLVARTLVKLADGVISISKITAERFTAWSGVARDKISILQNAVHTNWYKPGPKSAELVHRYGIAGKTVIATLGRLVSEERYKGFDEVLDAIPLLLERVPNLVYLVMGDGTDRARLERRIADRGLAQHVVFTGFVEEAEKADHFRLIDVYVMPSRGEGFGFVILEALACGIPVIGSKLDGTREALRDGLLGEVVDPDDPVEICDAVLRALSVRTRVIPEALMYFDYPVFCQRAAAIVSPFLVEERAVRAPLSSWISAKPGAS